MIAVLGISTGFTIAICYLLYCFLFVPDTLKEYKRPYKKTGLSYIIKYAYFWIYETFLRRKKLRFNDIEVFSNDINKNGLKISPSKVKLENPQKNLNKNVDEVTFMGVNLKSGSFLEINLARHEKDFSEAAINFIVNVDGKILELELPNYPMTLYRTKEDNDNSWKSKNLKIWCLTPMMRWRIGYNGFLKDKATGEVYHVILSYVWVQYSRVTDHQNDISKNSICSALAKSSGSTSIEDLKNILNQLDQWGTLYGNYSIDGQKEEALPLWGCKILRRGENYWNRVNEFLEIKGYCNDGTVIYFRAISILSDLPEIIHGYVELWNGDRHLIKSTDLEFIKLKDFNQSLSSLFSMKFKAGNDEYLLAVRKDHGSISHYWGANEEITIKKYNSSFNLTSLLHNLTLNGSGSVAYGCKNDCQKYQSKQLKPYLVETDIDSKDSKEVPNIVAFNDPLCSSSKIVGGKGCSLSLLKQINGEFRVPGGFCITAKANVKFIDKNAPLRNGIKEIAHLYRNGSFDKVEQECSRLIEKFMEIPFPEVLEVELKDEFKKIYGALGEEIKFAVRSSAVGEDGEEMSAAGQLETVLGCKGLKKICESIKACWASCYNFRAVEYRRQNGQPIETGVGVVIQEMIDADIAGVLFTRDPVKGSPGIISISANYGIGESVVSAMSEPDTIEINRSYDDQLSIGNITIGKKEIQVHLKDEGGVIKTNCDSRSKECCLSHDQAITLSKLSIMIEQSYGNPKDIEWAISNNKFYILQARPITNLYPETDYYLKNELNSSLYTDEEFITAGNLKEVFPGAVSPLSVSLFASASNHCYNKLRHILGRHDLKNHLSNKGRVFFNQHRFNNRGETQYATPSDSKSFKDGIDVALNGRIIDDGNLQQKMKLRSRYYSRFNGLMSTLNIINATLSPQNLIKDMEQQYSTFCSLHPKTPLDKAVTHLYNTTGIVSENLLNHLKLSLNSIVMNTQILNTLLGSSTDFTGDHYSDFALLLSTETASEDVESADVPSALQKLAEKITMNSEEAEEFLELSGKDCVRFMSNPNTSFTYDYMSFLSRHGHRCWKEFDVHSKSWRMEPEKLVGPLQALVKSKKQTSRIKKYTIDEALMKIKTPLTLSEKNSLKKKVIKARKSVAYREQAKSWLIKSADVCRNLSWNLATRMVEEERIPDKELFFFMTYDEIHQLLATRSAKIVQKAMKRKRLFPELNNLKFPEIMIGIPEPIEELYQADDNLAELKGTPVSLGSVVGIARVISTVEEASNTLQHGDILVTHSTDIAWSPYFPSLSGVITELGGLISHGAVVAREYGIPCVVSVENATKILKSGDKIRLNGNDGTIEKLN